MLKWPGLGGITPGPFNLPGLLETRPTHRDELHILIQVGVTPTPATILRSEPMLIFRATDGQLSPEASARQANFPGGDYHQPRPRTVEVMAGDGFRCARVTTRTVPIRRANDQPTTKGNSMKHVMRYQSQLLFRKSYKPNRTIRIRPSFRPIVQKLSIRLIGDRTRGITPPDDHFTEE